MTLSARCAQFLKRPLWDGRIGRQRQLHVDDLVAFVIAETGRSAAGHGLDDSLPVCVYFPTAADREQFIRSVQELKPSMTMMRMP